MLTNTTFDFNNVLVLLKLSLTKINKLCSSAVHNYFVLWL